jgi:hypothetical protein
MTPRRLFSWALLAAAALAVTCATSGPRKYPPRRPGCALAVFTSATPQIAGGWDDIGIAQANCYLDESDITCLHRLKIEACRMGGDILYNVPKRVSRPEPRGMVIQARVAHTITSTNLQEKEKQEAAMAPPAANNEPVVPIGAPTPVAVPDAGTAADASRDGAERG